VELSGKGRKVIKQYKDFVIATGIMLGIIFLAYTFWVKPMRNTATYALGRVEAIEEEAKRIETETQAVIEGKDGEISELKAENKKLERTIETIETVLTSKNREITELEAEFVTLTDKDAMILNLQSQVEKWKEQFNLIQEVIGKKNTQIFNLTAQYEAQLEISKSWKLRYDQGKQGYEAERELRKQLAKDLYVSRTGHRVKNFLLLVLGTVTAYEVLK
jgi:chromosome segregation ATPase